jgi:hypothetical protein
VTLLSYDVSLVLMLYSILLLILLPRYKDPLSYRCVHGTGRHFGLVWVAGQGVTLQPFIK